MRRTIFLSFAEGFRPCLLFFFFPLLSLVALGFLFFSFFFCICVARLLSLEEEESSLSLSLSLSLSDLEELEDETDKVESSLVSQLGPGDWYWDSWLRAAGIGGAGGINNSLKDVVNSGLDIGVPNSRKAVGIVSGVKIGLHDNLDVGIR
jgi:hypothetical protein